MEKLDPRALTTTAKEAVLYANTPSYLLERLRKDSGVRLLQTELKPACLGRHLYRATKVASAEEMVWKYMLVVALATSDWPYKWKVFSRADLGDLEWGNLLWQLVKAEDIPTSSTTTMINPTIQGATYLWNNK